MGLGSERGGAVDVRASWEAGTEGRRRAETGGDGGARAGDRRRGEGRASTGEAAGEGEGRGEGRLGRDRREGALDVSHAVDLLQADQRLREQARALLLVPANNRVATQLSGSRRGGRPVVAAFAAAAAAAAHISFISGPSRMEPTSVVIHASHIWRVRSASRSRLSSIATCWRSAASSRAVPPSSDLPSPSADGPAFASGEPGAGGMCPGIADGEACTAGDTRAGTAVSPPLAWSSPFANSLDDTLPTLGDRLGEHTAFFTPFACMGPVKTCRLGKEKRRSRA